MKIEKWWWCLKILIYKIPFIIACIAKLDSLPNIYLGFSLSDNEDLSEGLNFELKMLLMLFTKPPKVEIHVQFFQSLDSLMLHHIKSTPTKVFAEFKQNYTTIFCLIFRASRWDTFSMKSNVNCETQFFNFQDLLTFLIQRNTHMKLKGHVKAAKRDTFVTIIHHFP